MSWLEENQKVEKTVVSAMAKFFRWPNLFALLFCCSHLFTFCLIGAGYLQMPLVRRVREVGIRTICFAWEDGAVCKDVPNEFYPILITEKGTL